MNEAEPLKHGDQFMKLDIVEILPASPIILVYPWDHLSEVMPFRWSKSNGGCHGERLEYARRWSVPDIAGRSSNNGHSLLSQQVSL